MGLDMYIFRKNEISGEDEELVYWRKANAIFKLIETTVGKIENCEEIYLTQEHIEEMQDVLREARKIIVDGKIKYVKKNAVVGQTFKNGNWEDVIKEVEMFDDEIVEKLEKVLPTQDGFFYGSTLYDKNYYQDIDYTFREFAKLICDTTYEDWKNNKIYFLAWW